MRKGSHVRVEAPRASVMLRSIHSRSLARMLQKPVPYFRATLLVLVAFAGGCSDGFSIDERDAGMDSGPLDADAEGRVDAGTRDIASPDVAVSDGGPDDVGVDAGTPDVGCTVDEACDDMNACTEDDFCSALTGCGGADIECSGSEVSCEGDLLVTVTSGPACDAESGCVLQRETTACPYSCAGDACLSCVSTAWTQRPIPVRPEDGSSQFAIDALGGQHIVFQTRRMGMGFLEPAVDYAYRESDSAAWLSEALTPTDAFTSDTSLATFNGEPHALTITSEAMTYWHRSAGVWSSESVPGRAFRDTADVVVTNDGQVHVVRSASGGIRHARRVDGSWVEEPIDMAMGFTDDLNAIAVGADIHVAFGDGGDGVGYAHFDGTRWTWSIQDVGERIRAPRIAALADGSAKIVFGLDERGDLGVADISAAGTWSVVGFTVSVNDLGGVQDIAIDSEGATHLVFRTTSPREVYYAYRGPGGGAFAFDLIVEDTALSFGLEVDSIGKLRMVSEHVLSFGGRELRFSERQHCP